MKIGIASDHRGFKIKEEIKQQLKNKYEIVDYGTNSEENVDFVDYAKVLCQNYLENQVEFGILLCGTGIGMSIAANKIKGIRCAKVDNVIESSLSRKHNNANILAINCNKKAEEIIEIIEIFLTTEFSNEERYIRRNKKIEEL